MSPGASLPSCWRRAFLPSLVYVIGVHGAVTFPGAIDGPLQGVSIYSPPETSFIGPQPDDSWVTSITGPMAVVDGDLCEPLSLNASGHVVLATVDAVYAVYCSMETAYLNMIGTGAAAYLWANLEQPPCNSVYWHDGWRGARTRHLAVPFLAIQPAPEVYQAMLDQPARVNVTVYPDRNVWVPYLASWPYQLFVRVIPSAILLASGAVATSFYIFHMVILNDKFCDTTIASKRTITWRLKFAWRYMDVPHVILAIEMVTATLAGIVLAVGGYHSTANLPAPVTNYFTTLLGGWGFAASTLSASIWAQKLSFIMPSADQILVVRVIRGDYRLVTVSLCVIPVMLDTAMNLSFASYYFAPSMVAAESAIMFTFQLGISTSVLWTLVHYRRTANRIQVGVAGTVRDDERGVDRLLAPNSVDDILCHAGLGCQK